MYLFYKPFRRQPSKYKPSTPLKRSHSFFYSVFFSVPRYQPPVTQLRFLENIPPKVPTKYHMHITRSRPSSYKQYLPLTNPQPNPHLYISPYMPQAPKLACVLACQVPVSRARYYLPNPSELCPDPGGTQLQHRQPPRCHHQHPCSRPTTTLHKRLRI